jgi:hypothetical protein
VQKIISGHTRSMHPISVKMVAVSAVCAVRERVLLVPRSSPLGLADQTSGPHFLAFFFRALRLSDLTGGSADRGTGSGIGSRFASQGYFQPFSQISDCLFPRVPRPKAEIAIVPTLQHKGNASQIPTANVLKQVALILPFCSPKNSRSHDVQKRYAKGRPGYANCRRRPEKATPDDSSRH